MTASMKQFVVEDGVRETEEYRAKYKVMPSLQPRM
jgi:hypothetical protein